MVKFVTSCEFGFMLGCLPVVACVQIVIRKGKYRQIPTHGDLLSHLIFLLVPKCQVKALLMGASACSSGTEMSHNLGREVSSADAPNAHNGTQAHNKKHNREADSAKISTRGFGACTSGNCRHKAACTATLLLSGCNLALTHAKLRQLRASRGYCALYERQLRAHTLGTHSHLYRVTLRFRSAAGTRSKNRLLLSSEVGVEAKASTHL